MNIDLSQLSTSEVYSTMAQTLIPRPIAWVLSDNGDGHYNLAPFSYFSAVCSDPPLIMFSVGKKSDGTPKDTRINIEKRRDFVLHIPSWDLLEPMNESAATLPAGVSEIDAQGLALTEFSGFRLPRLRDSRLAMACELYQIQEIGSAPQALIFGRILNIYIEDEAVEKNAEGKLRIRPERLDPVGRLGGPNYTKLGRIMNLPRPK